MNLAPIIARLLSGGETLTGGEAEALGCALAAAAAAGGAAASPPAPAEAPGLCQLQLSALLVLLAREERYTAAQLTGLARALRAAALVVPGEAAAAAPAAASAQPPLVDIVGTGGDGAHSVNISTCAAVVAAACGARVAKHGSVGATSRCGAADVLAALGVPHVGPAGAAACLARARLAFLYAPLFHPALAAAAPVRRALRCRTIFNLLGPLTNPAGARRLVLGVFAPALLPLYAEAAAALGAEHALIVHCALPGGGGLDELAPAGACAVIEVRAGVAPHAHYTVDAAAWAGPGALPRCTAADLEGGDAAVNAALLRHLLAGEAAWADAAAADALPRVGTPPRAPNIAAMAHAVALNAGACLYVAGEAASLQAGCAAALAALRAGAGAAKLRNWSAAAQAAARDEREAAAAAT